MTEPIETLVSALREELQQYGEMLALLERQQAAVIQRAPHEVFQSISVIKSQGQAMQQARDHREECRRAVAGAFARPAEIGFAELTPALPADYQPLVKALVEENNQLIARVRQRARQNQMLLSRSVELMQGVLNALFPTRQPAVYNGHGDVHHAASADRPLCNALG